MPAVAALRCTLLTRVPPELNDEVEDFRRDFRREEDPNIPSKTDTLEHLIRVGLKAEARRRQRSSKPESASA